MIHENYGITMEKARRMAQPRGGMCAVCKGLFDDCSGLNFEGMRTIDTHPLNTGVC